MSEAVEKALNEIRRVEGAITAALSEQEKKSGDSSQKLGDEIKSLNQEWEAKAKDLRELYEKSISETNTVNVELKRRVEDLEKRLGHPGAISGQGASADELRGRKTAGELFTEKIASGTWDSVIGSKADGYSTLAELKKSPQLEMPGHLMRNSGRPEQKATLSSDATRFVAPYRDMLLEFPKRILTVRDYMNRIPVASNAFEYVRMQGTGPSTALSLSGVVSTGLVATATAAAAHGLKIGDIVSVEDSTDTEYNGIFRVTSVPSTTTFTYNMLTDPADDSADGTIVYRPLSFGGAAAERAEGGAKPQVKRFPLLVNGTIRSIAHYEKVSKELLDDLPQMRAIIDTDLVYGVDLKAERQAFYGTGVSPQVEGILSVAGRQTLSQGSLTAVDVIRKAAMLVGMSDFSADLCVANDFDWYAIETKKGSDDHYVLAAGAAGSEPRVWRIPVHVTNSILPGDVLVGNFARGAAVYDREVASVQFSDSNEDDFLNNLLAIRGEARLAYAWKYPGAFCHISFTG